jgi:WD40-like Beta Propeller Repeat
MQKRILWLFTLLALLISGVTAQAQINTAPIIFLKDGDLWAWDGTLRQLTNRGYNDRPILSPDGSLIAYTAMSEIGIAALETGFVGDSPLPNDIWVLDVANGQTTRIVAQPIGASFNVQNTPSNFIVRSEPSWSADRNRIAWSELVFPDFTHRLVMHDLTTNSTTVIANLPEPAGILGPAIVRWVGSWITILTSLYDATADVITDTTQAYSTTGTRSIDVHLTGSDANDFVLDIFEVMQAGQAYIGISYVSGFWQLIDPQTGAEQPMDVLPELYGLQAPADAPTLQFFPYLSADGTQRIYDWSLVSPFQPVNLPYSGFISGIALSPDGQSVAYLGENGIEIWQEQVIAESENAAAVVWGPVGLRIPDLPDQGGGTINTCSGFMPSRLFPGGLGRVTPGDPNNIRTAPGYANAALGLIPGGNVFEVITGPVCADNTAWWQVNYLGRLGWVAEGSGNIYWLEPAASYPTPTPFATQPVICAMSPRLTVGATAQVTFGPSNTLRAWPGFNGAVTGQLAGGTMVRVFSGPRCVDGVSWWEVGEPFVFAGWTAEGQNGEYWLVSVVCPNGLISRLAPNRAARVTPGTPNNLRDQPPTGATASNVIGQIPGSSNFTIISGPQCGSDGLMYWQVNFNGTVGWTAEGDQGAYWLEPT